MTPEEMVAQVQAVFPDGEPPIGTDVKLTMGSGTLASTSYIATRATRGWFIVGSAIVYEWPNIVIGWDSIEVVK